MIKEIKTMNIMMGLLVVLLLVTIFQSYQISKLSGIEVATTTSSTSGEDQLQQILAEITPTGTPDYGKKAGVSYDDVEGSVRTLAEYLQSITLSGDEQARFIDVGTTRGTACEFCCGIGGAGFGTSDGQVACGCAHNVAFGGLTKWLIQNTKYTNQQIVDEIQKWKILFFPQGTLERELAARNINPEAVGLPAMRGGC